MQRQILAIALVITGLALGIIGNIFFYEQSLGLSVPLFIFIFIGLSLLWASVNKISLSLRNLWLVIPIAFFAMMFVLRASPSILLLDGLAILALIALFLRYLNHEGYIDEGSSKEHTVALVDASVHSFIDTRQEIDYSWQWLKSRRWNTASPLISVGRGLLFALPIVIIFAILFSSADAIFSEWLSKIFELFALDKLQVFGLRILFVLGLAWLTTGLLSYGLSLRQSEPIAQANHQSFQESDTSDSLKQKTPKKFSLNITESTIILMSVVLLFGFFVFIQLTYFFAGEIAIAEGLTYSAYARRGFFELLAVSVITLALMLALDHITKRNTPTQNIIFRGLSFVMVALTFVIMVSAWQRMSLYEEAYGFTYLRVYSHTFIAWLAILLAIALVHLFRVKTNLFALGVLLVTIGYLGTLNLMNVDYYITERNIVRYHNGEELDLCYLDDLSIDALPSILELYNTTENADLRVTLIRLLRIHQQNLEDRYADSTIFEMSFVHNSAWQQLEIMDFSEGVQRTSCRYRDE